MSLSSSERFFMFIELSSKLHARKMKQILFWKNPTGAKENPGSRIHRLAPPEEVTRDSVSSA